VGYAGGDREDPTYHALGNHIETVQVEFDPTVISYAELVDLMLKLHNPAAKPSYLQYSSIILASDDEQLKIADERVKAASKRLGKTLSTRVELLVRFWPAEDYHQKYYLRQNRTLMSQFRGMLGADETALRESTAAARVNGYVSGNGTKVRLKNEIAGLGLDAPAREHLESLVGDTATGAPCALP
jgi:peptide-methionine (S)-S-oxide reductase